MYIALISSANYKYGYKDSELLIEAFHGLGHEARLEVWDDKEVDWAAYDIAFFHTCWDYTDKFIDFMNWCEKASKQTVFVNDFKTIKYNCTKQYLLTLNEKGIRLPPTKVIPKGSDINNLLPDGFANGQIVIKPLIDASGKRARKFSTFDKAVHDKNVQLLSQESDLLLQSFEEKIYEGEYSAVFIGGTPSHCVKKQPQRDEFRVQEEHGGVTTRIEFTDNIINYCNRVIRLLPTNPLYLRIDFINLEEPILMEVEMIEPDLFLRYSESAASVLAQNVIDHYKLTGPASI